MDEKSCNPLVNWTKRLIFDILSEQCTKTKKRTKGYVRLSTSAKMIQKGRVNLWHVLTNMFLFLVVEIFEYKQAQKWIKSAKWTSDMFQRTCFSLLNCKIFQISTPANGWVFSSMCQHVNFQISTPTSGRVFSSMCQHVNFQISTPTSGRVFSSMCQHDMRNERH
jgi:hypothetical protein